MNVGNRIQVRRRSDGSYVIHVPELYARFEGHDVQRLIDEARAALFKAGRPPLNGHERERR